MKINIRKIFTALLAVGLTTIGGALTALNAQTLHPTGLNTLHENIPGISKAGAGANALATLPSSVDLSGQCPAVGDQLYLGSCVAFATAYAEKTYQEGIEHKWEIGSYTHIYSPAFIYSLGHATNNPDGGGMYFSNAFQLFVDDGCTTWTDMPYNGNYYAWQTQPTAAQMANAANFKAQSWTQLPSGSPSDIKAQLAAGVPVIIGIPVYPDFDNLSPSNPVYDNASGYSRGNHAICIIGYDDSMNAFKFINSWGTSWGINGYGWISYDFIVNQYIEAYFMTDIVLPQDVHINGWTLPGAPVHGDSYRVIWNGYSSSSYVFLYARAQGTSTWYSFGSGYSFYGSTTAVGAWTPSAAGVWQFGVGYGGAQPTSVTATITAY